MENIYTEMSEHGFYRYFFIIVYSLFKKKQHFKFEFIVNIFYWFCRKVCDFFNRISNVDSISRHYHSKEKDNQILTYWKIYVFKECISLFSYLTTFEDFLMALYLLILRTSVITSLHTVSAETGLGLRYVKSQMPVDYQAE